MVVAHPLATSVEAEGAACGRRPSSSEAVVVSEAGTQEVVPLGDPGHPPVTPPDPEGAACAEVPVDPSTEEHHRPACDDGPADLVVGDALHPVGVAGVPSDHPDEEARA